MNNKREKKQKRRNEVKWRTEQANSSLLKKCIALFNLYALLFLFLLYLVFLGVCGRGWGFVVFLSWGALLTGEANNHLSLDVYVLKTWDIFLLYSHYVNLNCSFNQWVFNQCINEQHTKYLPNIHTIYYCRFETNTYRTQREYTQQLIV